MMQSETIGALSLALAKSQGELEDAGKTKQAHGYKYAELGTVLGLVRPVLSRHGLAVIQTVSRSENEIAVTTMLCHESGEWVRDTARAPLVIPVGRSGQQTLTDIQAMGSITTYLRRYSLAAIVGITQIDDDGQMREDAHERTSARQFEPIPTPGRQNAQPEKKEPQNASQAPQNAIESKPAVGTSNQEPLKDSTTRAIFGSAVATFGPKEAKVQINRLREQLGLPPGNQMSEAQGQMLLMEIARLANG
jgi:hypothetical protein